MPSKVPAKDFAQYVALDAKTKNWSGGNLSLEQRKAIKKELDQISAGWPDHVRARAGYEAGAEDLAKDYRYKIPPDLRKVHTLAQVKAALANRLKKDFAGKKIAIRATAPNLLKVLTEGRFKTQHEVKSESIGVHYDPSHRAGREEELFGIPRNADPLQRPVYGYVATAGTGDFIEMMEVSAYGGVEVVLKDGVRSRTTALVGDSLNDRSWAQPSPVDDPTWQSARPISGWKGEVGMVEDFENESTRKHHYTEAQIHGGVRVSDIEEVVFPEPPDASMKAALAKAGIPWKVVKPRAYDYGNSR